MNLFDVIAYKDKEAGRRDSLAIVFDIRGKKIQLLPLGRSRPKAISLASEKALSGRKGSALSVSTDIPLWVEQKDIVKNLGAVSRPKADEILKAMTHRLIEKHYEVVHRNSREFVPGETYIYYSGPVWDAQEMKSLGDATLDFWLAAGKYAQRFEKEFAGILGSRYCSLTNSGSSANLLAVSALTSPALGDRRLKPGDEVIGVAATFPTTVTPVIQNNLVPVFVDIELKTYNIQADQIEAAISPKTKAIFLPHTLGNPFDLDTVMAVAKKHRLWVIEDNCDALGSQYRGRPTGSYGDIGTASFYPPHHMTMGEGGALVTNDLQLKKLIESFRDWGKDCWCKPGKDNACGKRFTGKFGSLPAGYDHKYVFSHLGYNLKITDLQASVGVAQLKKLSFLIKRRRENWKYLRTKLQKLEEYFILPEPSPHSDPSWFGFLLTVRDTAPFTRADIVHYLEESKVATRMLFAGNITRHPGFDNVRYRIHGELKNTDLVMNNTFWVGVYAGLTPVMLDYMVTTIMEFVKRKK